MLWGSAPLRLGLGAILRMLATATSYTLVCIDCLLPGCRVDPVELFD